MREIVLDTETTGLDYKRGDRIIEVACVELINHVATNNHFQFYCSTNKMISEDAKKIHRVTNYAVTYEDDDEIPLGGRDSSRKN